MFVREDCLLEKISKSIANLPQFNMGTLSVHQCKVCYDCHTIRDCTLLILRHWSGLLFTVHPARSQLYAAMSLLVVELAHNDVARADLEYFLC